MIFSVRRPQYLYLLWKHKPVIESNSTTKCGHPSKQEVCFSIQSGYPTLPYRSAGHKVHWHSWLPYIQGYWGGWNSDFSWVLLNSKTQVDSPRLFLLRLSRSSLAWKQELWMFFSEETHSHWHLFRNTEPTIYDVYHIVVIVHFDQCWCGHTVARLT